MKSSLTWMLIIVMALGPQLAASEFSDRLLQISPDRTAESVRVEFGEPEIRSVRKIDQAIAEDFYYRTADRELVRLTFIGGTLKSTEAIEADTSAPTLQPLDIETLKR